MCPNFIFAVRQRFPLMSCLYTSRNIQRPASLCSKEDSHILHTRIISVFHSHPYVCLFPNNFFPNIPGMKTNSCYFIKQALFSLNSIQTNISPILTHNSYKFEKYSF